MKKCFYLGLVTALALVACSRNREVDAPKADMTIVARTESPDDSKTVVESGTHVFWEPGDELAVFSGERSGKYSTEITEPSASAIFTGTLGTEPWTEDMELWAVYPYSEDAVFDGETITTTLPSEQVARAGSFGKDMNLSIAHTTAGNTLQFYNVGGGIRFSVTKEGIKKVVFEGLEGEIISGKVKIGFENGLPKIQEVTSGSQFITLLPPAGQNYFQTNTWYFIVAIPGALEGGYKLRFYMEESSWGTSSTTSVSIKRSLFGSLYEIDKNAEFYTDETAITLSDGSVLKAGTKYFGDGNEAYITVLDTNKVSVSPGTPSSLNLSIGDIVLVPYSDKLPTGFCGKIISTENKDGDTIFLTKSAPLDDVFEELHVNSTFQVFENDSVLVDGEGNQYSGTLIDSSIWDYIDSGDYPRANPESTKAEVGAEFNKTLSIDISSDYFSGNLILASTLAAVVDITNGKMTNYEFSVGNRSYLTGHLGLESGGSTSFVIVKEKEMHLPVGIPITPVIKLQPIISFSIEGSCSGEIKYGGDFHLGLADNTVTFKNGQYTKTSGDAGGCKLSPYYLDCEGSVTVEPQVSLLFDVWGLKQLGLGVKAAPSVTLGLSGTMQMENQFQLKKDVKASLTIGGSVGVFMYAGKIFNGGVKIEGNYDLGSITSVIDLLDKGKGFDFTYEPGEWSVEGKFEDETLMSVDDKGLSLFKKGEDEPIMSLSMTRGTKASTSFDVPFDAADYYVCAYNEVGDYKFYGAPLTPLIKSFTYRDDLWSINRDEYYKIQSIDVISSWNSRTINLQYEENQVEWYDMRSPLGEAIMTSILDENGYIQSNTITWYDGGGGFRTSTFDHQDSSISITCDNYHALIELDDNENWISFKEWNSDWGDMYTYYTFQYLDIPDLFDIDLLRIMLFGYFDIVPIMSFTGFHCPTLPASFWTGQETIAMNYVFYENGLVKDIQAFKDIITDITYE